MFQMRLQALEHPDPAAVDAENRKVFANTVLWLEDQVIRFYTIEDRADLRNLENIKLWEDAYQRYKTDLCAPTFYSATEDLFWLLSYGVRLSFLDSPEKFENISSSRVELKQDLSLSKEESDETQIGFDEAKQENTSELADSEEVDMLLNMMLDDESDEEEKGTSSFEAPKAGGAQMKRWDKPGRMSDPLLKGLSGAGRKWFSRFIARGATAEEAREMVDKRSKISTLNDNHLGDNFKRRLSGAGRKWFSRFIAQGATAEEAREMVDKRRTKKQTVGEIIDSCQQRRSRTIEVDAIGGYIGEHSPETYSTKRSKISTLNDSPLGDSFKRGLSGAGRKWLSRFIAQGATVEEARKMVEKRRKNNHYVLPDKTFGEIIESGEQRQSRIIEEDIFGGNKREHSPETNSGKRSKILTSNDNPLSDPFKKGLSGAGKKWYMRFIEGGFEPSVARQMAEQRRSKPNATIPIEYKPNQKQTNEVELLVVDRGSKDGIIPKKNWKHLKIRLVTAFVSLMKEFPGPVPAYRDAKTSIVNGRPIICEDKRSADLFQLAILQMGRLWPRAQLEVFPIHKKKTGDEKPSWSKRC